MLKTIASVFLSFQVLIASAGISIYKHTCLVFDVTDISFGTPKVCSGEMDNEDSQIDFKCCSLDHDYLQVDFDGDITANDFVLDSELSFSIDAPVFAKGIDRLLSGPKNNSPPLLFSRKNDYLTSIQVFLI